MLEISDLCDEMLIKILSFLNAFELINCSYVSIRFEILAQKIKLPIFHIPSFYYLECQDENENIYFSSGETELLQFNKGKLETKHTTMIRNYRNYNVYKNEIFASCLGPYQNYECLFCDLDDYKQNVILEDTGYDLIIDEELIFFKTTEECSDIKFYDIKTKNFITSEKYLGYCLYINKNLRLRLSKDKFILFEKLEELILLEIPKKEDINHYTKNYKILNKKYLVLINNFNIFVINLITLKVIQIKNKIVLVKNDIFMLDQYLILNINNDVHLYYLFEDNYKLLGVYTNTNVKAIEKNKYVYINKY